jgi:hypothetical protein
MGSGFNEAEKIQELNAKSEFHGRAVEQNFTSVILSMTSINSRLNLPETTIKGFVEELKCLGILTSLGEKRKGTAPAVAANPQ